MANVSKSNKLCKHKHNTKKTCPVEIYLFKLKNLPMCNGYNNKKTKLKAEELKLLCLFRSIKANIAG